MKNFLLLLLLALALPAAAMQPRWVSKGVKELNNDRTNESYEFRSFNTHNVDLSKLQRERLQPVYEFLEAEYGAKPGSCRTDSVLLTDGRRAMRIEFAAPQGEEEVYALPIDTYYEFSDYDETAFEFEYYQLYAISKPGLMPQFDEYELTQKYNSEALAKSIIPGMGQLYKGQNTKAWVIIGGEAFFVASAIVFDMKRAYCNKRSKEGENVPSWISKTRGWREFRNGAIICACTLYAYNLLDAALSKGARQVRLGRGTTASVAVTPLGLGVAVNF